jgi:hypothetical protein
VADTDGDIVRCRWAKAGPPDECAGFVYFILFYSFTVVYINRVCNGLPDALLNNESCTITYTAKIADSWVVALKIEDYEFSSQAVPLSGTSIQFIVTVTPITESCTTRRKLLGIHIRK